MDFCYLSWGPLSASWKHPGFYLQIMAQPPRSKWCLMLGHSFSQKLPCRASTARFQSNLMPNEATRICSIAHLNHRILENDRTVFRSCWTPTMEDSRAWNYCPESVRSLPSHMAEGNVSACGGCSGDFAHYYFMKMSAPVKLRQEGSRAARGGTRHHRLDGRDKVSHKKQHFGPEWQGGNKNRESNDSLSHLCLALPGKIGA